VKENQEEVNRSGTLHSRIVAHKQPQTTPPVNEFLTISEAAAFAGKTRSNISYLIQYNRLNKYNPNGERIERATSGELRISRTELLDYLRKSQERINRRMKELSITNTELSFADVPERIRTKHVHRLHPYLGKFIPQLVEYFLSRYFKAGQVVVDPFCGSGTTLVQASEMGINSVGMDISEFNVLISRVKIASYDLKLAEKEISEITARTVAFSEANFDQEKETLALKERSYLENESDYLNAWFAKRSLKELLFFKSLIPEYKYQDLLKVLLSRTARSCRLTYHYELANPSKPIKEPYPCYKHKGKICRPVTSILPRLKFYGRDTLRRISEFSKLRARDTTALVFEADSRIFDLEKGVDGVMGEGWFRRKIEEVGAGVFTSPPYVGQIDYHEQHRYAYELFGLRRRDSFEIGRKSLGKGEKAREEYIDGISNVLINVRKYLLPPKSVWFIVANDNLSLYPKIFDRAGLVVRRVFHRPVEDRTERDKGPYSESIFLLD
jgi:DNA modification methylase